MGREHSVPDSSDDYPRVVPNVPDLMPKLLSNLPLLLLSVALVVGMVWSYRVWQETRGEDAEPDATPEDLLQQFREAHAAGELDDEEFQRVRTLLKNSVSVRYGAGLLDSQLDASRPKKDRRQPAPDSSSPAPQEPSEEGNEAP